MALESLSGKFWKRKRETDFAGYKRQFANRFGDVLSRLPSKGEPGLLSVVLPVFNGGRYLNAAIESVLGQTYDSIELILVNDGSADNSGEICRGFERRYNNIRYIEFKENRRLPAALNAGFSAAHGEYYTWISHDNIMLPEFAEKMIGELRQGGAMVYGCMRLIDENGAVLRGSGWFEFPPLSGNVIFPKSTERLNDIANNTIGAAFVYLAGAAEFLGGYDEGLFGIEDYDYWMRMNEIFGIRRTESTEPLYLYRIHGESLTARDSALKITENRPRLMERDLKRRRCILKCRDIDEVCRIVRGG